MKKIIISMIVSTAMLAVMVYTMGRSTPPPLPPVLLQIEPWTLTDHNGQPFGSTQLKGKVWVANFFFTRCPSICPELINKMAQLQKNLVQQAHVVSFVSFSVDPEYDTPQVLQQYQSEKNVNHAATANWTFVTGSKKQLYELVVQKMKLHVGEKKILQDGSQRFDIGHVAHFVLFDQQGNLRGLFNTTPQGLEDLQHKAQLLIRHAPPKHS